MAKTVNTAFGVQNVAEVVCSFFNIVTNLYITLVHFLGDRALSCGESTGLVLLDCLPWSVLSVWRLVSIAQSSDAVVQEANRTEQLVNRLLLLLPSAGEHRGLHTSLQRFAHQLGSRGLTNSAAGLFTIDRSLLTSCVAAITTYLVILVQFGLPDASRQANDVRSC
ncbi:putative gustatory receptor 28b [Schistocerca gregaria]|uniref:putative gustatory receptor 28b n=1 Tax=Schistocerca gregaria TaxID=7010 RepID=UPI00211DB1A4|nr:putative gustatory receptor 28b [Schistocerca gregaria]